MTIVDFRRPPPPIESDERLLLLACARECTRSFRGKLPIDIAEGLGMRVGRMKQLLRYWKRRGWWDFDVALEAGYVTTQGLVAARAMG